MDSSKDDFTNLFESSAARDALKDLNALGYDIDALMRRKMNEEQIIELRDKAFRYRGIEASQMTIVKQNQLNDNAANLLKLGVDLSLAKNTSPDEARNFVRNIIYLAERQLSDS